MQEDKYFIVINELTDKLKEFRASKKLSQKEVAYKAEMEEQNYRRIELGNTNPTIKSLVKICNALDIEIKDLFI